MRVTVLAGGTGGTKLAHGFALLEDAVDLSIVANVGDDTEIHGLVVSPDVDTLLYTLSGLVDRDRGWGIAGDTMSAHAQFERLGEPTWFTVGDADLATHVHRTRRLRHGDRLTDVVGDMAVSLGIRARILPATDDRHRTIVETDVGALAFQEYFVRLRQQPVVRAVRYDGVGQPTPEVLEAIASADLVVIGPSNPIVSIEPILVLPGVREAVAAVRARTVAVSPIVAGRALKGPADRMLDSLGHEVSALGVARLYADVVERFVVDEADADLAPLIEDELGMAVEVLPTVMRTDDDRRRLATALVALA